MKKSAVNIPKVPNLRFPGFVGEWEIKRIAELCQTIGDGLHGTPEYTNSTGYYFINGNNLIDGEVRLNKNTKEVSHNTWSKNEKRFSENTLFLSINGTIGSVARFKKEKVMLGKSVAYLDFNDSSDFYFHLLQSKKIQNHFFSELTGTTIKNLSLKTIRKTETIVPSALEQKKIASFLSILDNRISTQNKIIEELKLLKSTLRNRLFEMIINEENQVRFIKDILEYEQPTKYLVSDTNYLSDKSLIPVLTANKAFILGYTDECFGIYEQNECIIFDDFTLDFKYVNFPFKVKSSAIKILKPKPNVNLRFVFEYFSFLNIQSSEHKRHYISEIEPMGIAMPDIFTQNKTAKALLKIDKKLAIERALFDLYSQQKQYLLKNLFI